MKKIKLCFKTSDYESQNIKDTIFIILDSSRGYYGIKFCIDDKSTKYGKVTCFNSGIDYDSNYFERTFYNLCFYHRHPSWKKEYKSRIFHFHKYSVKCPIDV